MDPKHDGQFAAAPGIGGRKDVQIEAILARARILKAHILERSLHAVGSVFCRIALALPMRSWLRRLPAQSANRRRGKGDTKKGAHLSGVDQLAMKLALLNLDLQRISMCHRGKSDCHQCQHRCADYSCTDSHGESSRNTIPSRLLNWRYHPALSARR